MVTTGKRDVEILEIYQRNISTEEKIRLLEEAVNDLINEMEAQDQNMNPELHNRLSEGLRLAKNFLRELQEPQ